MNKCTHFIGQPMYGQLLNLHDKSKILRFCRENGGERYIKHFDAWQHLVIMLMYYVNSYTFFEEPEKDWAKILKDLELQPPEPTLFD